MEIARGIVATTMAIIITMLAIALVAFVGFVADELTKGLPSILCTNVQVAPLRIHIAASARLKIMKRNVPRLVTVEITGRGPRLRVDWALSDS